VTSVAHPGGDRRLVAAGHRSGLPGAVVDEDGETAASYVSAAARLEIRRHVGRRTDMRELLRGSNAADRRPHDSVSDSQLDELHYAVRSAGPDRIVTVTGSGGSLSFRLHPADARRARRLRLPTTPGASTRTRPRLNGRT